MDGDHAGYYFRTVANSRPLWDTPFPSMEGG